MQQGYCIGLVRNVRIATFIRVQYCAELGTECSEKHSDPSEDKQIMSSNDLPAYTSLEVAKHTSRNDAWIIVGGRVLDVSSWLDEHPGGDVVLLDAAGMPCLLELTPELVSL